jgi:hypothetical protein
LAAEGLEVLLPRAEERGVDAEGACRLGHGVALVSDELNGLDLELAGINTSSLSHDVRAWIKEKLGIGNLSELIQRAAQWVVESKYRSD